MTEHSPDRVEPLVVSLVDGQTDVRGLVAPSQRLLADLVCNDAALGWTDPPDEPEIEGLLTTIMAASLVGDAAMVTARRDDRLVGLGYWRRYQRPTHRPHADLERIAIAHAEQRRGAGKSIAKVLIAVAIEAGIEQMTLDLRGDNLAAFQLYSSLGFREYGRLDDFVAVDRRRLAKIFMVRDLRSAPVGTSSQQ